MRMATAVLILVLAMGWSTAGLFAAEGALDAERRRQLAEGTTGQRGEVLSWLAEHGTQADTAAVVPRLRDADSAVRQLAELTLWSMWLHSGSSETDGLVALGGQQMEAGDLDDAITTFTRVIERQPDFAEGYNKRATAYYLRGSYQESLDDIAETLKRNASHFGALSGAGLCLLKLERPAEALFYFERALAVNPNLDGIRSMVEALRTAMPRTSA